MNRRVLIGAVVMVAMASWFGGNLFAGDYYTSVPIVPTIKIGPDSEGAAPPEEVFGKEYSHTDWFTLFSSGGDPRLTNIEDHDSFATPDPLQVVSWDGIPLGVPDPLLGMDNSGSTNGFDYGSDTSFNFPEGQVDALANRGDLLFTQVVKDTASLLFSLTTDLDAGGSAKAHVHYEDPAGGDGVWAEIEASPAGPGIGPGVNHHVVEDLDALEVWGPEPPSHPVGGPDPVEEGYIGPANTADADRFSLDVDSASGVSVWGWDIPTKSVFPYIPHSVIVDAVEDIFLGPGLDYDMETRDAIDVDGTMVKDGGILGEWDTTDELLFTIDPLDSPMDVAGGPAPAVHGGEIMHLINTGGGSFLISFLTHGGHVWDTAFSPALAFGYSHDDVDALEAVGTLNGETEIPSPEPTSMVLLLCGIASLSKLRRR